MSYLLENTDIAIGNTHKAYLCAEQKGCPIHKLTSHHMRSWPQWFREDNGLMERTCEHGIGHPDPDGMHFFIERGMSYMGVHGCDGCCHLPTELTEV